MLSAYDHTIGSHISLTHHIDTCIRHINLSPYLNTIC